MKVRRKYKKKQRFPFLVLGLLLICCAFIFSLRILADPLMSQENQTQSEALSDDAFIQRLAPHAKELQTGYGVLPSIIIGQAILESDWGQSTLASKYNNLFGIKAFGQENKVSLETLEFYNGQWVTIDGDFRVYDSWEDSMDDHTMLFVNGVDWAPQLYADVLTATNYKEAALALQTAGYATDPNYAEKIIQVIETYQLNQFDN